MMRVTILVAIEAGQSPLKQTRLYRIPMMQAMDSPLAVNQINFLPFISSCLRNKYYTRQLAMMQAGATDPDLGQCGIETHKNDKGAANRLPLSIQSWRRHPDSNRRMEVLQTSALPLGYAAKKNGAGNGI